MALRKPLFMSSEGFAEEMAAADSIELGALSMSGQIDMNNNKIVELAAATANNDALAYGQSGAQLSGLNVLNQKITNLADPTGGTDAANKQYVDSVATGLDVKKSVRVATTANLVATRSGNVLTADANGSLPQIDGETMALNDRVLVKHQTTAADNGIYFVSDLGSAGTPYTLTRATDADTTTELNQGAFTFIEEGTLWADTGWVMSSDAPFVLNTDACDWTQFSQAGVIQAGQGLTKTGITIDAVGGPGILVNADDFEVELDTAANAQGAGSFGGSSGLEFHASGAAGRLRAAVHATGGLERTATGLAVKINDTPDTLDADASGLRVVGLPAGFKVNDVATTSGTVTAANLNILTDGSNADGLHRHRRVLDVETADEAIAAADPIYYTATGNRTGKATANDDSKARVTGVAKTAAAGSGSTHEVVSHGVCAAILSGATPGTPYYLQATGGIGTSRPAAGNRVIQVGIAKSSTDLWVRIVDYGKLAV